MIGEIGRAHSRALKEWAALYEADPVPGLREVGYLMRRAARLIDKAAGDSQDEEPLAPPSEAPTLGEARTG